MHGIGVELYEDDDEYEGINWYFKIERCHENEACASPDHIETFV